MNLIDLTIKPLNADEMDIVTKRYAQDFDKLSIDQAIKLLKLVINVDDINDSYDPHMFNLLIRRLHMIIDWTNYPERLL